MIFLPLMTISFLSHLCKYCYFTKTFSIIYTNFLATTNISSLKFMSNSRATSSSYPCSMCTYSIHPSHWTISHLWSYACSRNLFVVQWTPDFSFFPELWQNVTTNWMKWFGDWRFWIMEGGDFLMGWLCHWAITRMSDASEFKSKVKSRNPINVIHHALFKRCTSLTYHKWSSCDVPLSCCMLAPQTKAPPDQQVGWSLSCYLTLDISATTLESMETQKFHKKKKFKSRNQALLFDSKFKDSFRKVSFSMAQPLWDRHSIL